MIRHEALRHFLTSLLVLVLVCFCTLSQRNGLPAVINYSNYLAEDVVDHVVSQSVRVQRCAQYQKRQSEKPDVKQPRLVKLYGTVSFTLTDRQFFDAYIRHYIVRGPPVTLA